MIIIWKASFNVVQQKNWIWTEHLFYYKKVKGIVHTMYTNSNK